MKALFIRDSCARYQWSMSSKTKKKTSNAFAWLLFLLFLFLLYLSMRWRVLRYVLTHKHNYVTFCSGPAVSCCCCWGRGSSPSLGHSLWLCDVYRKEERWHWFECFSQFDSTAHQDGNSIRYIKSTVCDCVCAQQVSSISVYNNTFFFLLLTAEDSVFTFSSDVDKESDTTPAPNEEEEGRRRYTEEKVKISSQLLYGRAINNGQKSTARDRRPLENTNGNNTNQRPIIDDERVVRLVYNNSSRSGRSK